MEKKCSHCSSPNHDLCNMPYKRSEVAKFPQKIDVYTVYREESGQQEAAILPDDSVEWPETNGSFVEYVHGDLLKDSLTEAQEEIETFRMKLAACGVAALCNTKSTRKGRLDSSSPHYSASYQDVCDAVDREMALRERVAELEAALKYYADMVDPKSGLFMVAREALYGKSKK